MKKVLVTLFSITAGAALVHAQGFLQLTSGTTFGITTNTGTFGATTTPDQADGYSTIISGKTLPQATAPLGFYYALLFTPTGVGSSGDLANLNDGNWVQLAIDLSGTPGAALLGTNSAGLAGNFAAQGGGNSISALGATPLPNGSAFNNGTTYSVALVGWSSNLGSSWTAVSAELQSGVWSAAGNFGYVVASVNPSAAAPGNSPTGMFGNNSLTLYSVPVPEPTTIALAGLGGLSMLFLRRRKA